MAIFLKKEDLASLLEKISEGSTVHFERLYDRYFSKCYSIALYFLQSPEFAEDIVADVFLTLWQRKERLKDVKEWDNYLFTTIRNHTFTFLQKNPPQNLVDIDTYDIDIPGNYLTPEEKLLKKDMEEVIQQAIRELPQKTRIVYCMVKEKSMSYKQVSDALNISERTVNTHMTNAIRKLTVSLRNYLKK